MKTLFSPYNSTFTAKEHPYSFVRVYCELIGCDERQIKEHIRLAREENAPWDAAYRIEEAEWVRASDVDDLEFIELVTKEFDLPEDYFKETL